VINFDTISDQLTNTSFEKVFREFQPQLVASLPLNDVTFVAMIEMNDLFVGIQKATMEAEKTEADKAYYFLEYVISRDIENYFMKLLKVMEAYGGYLQSLVYKIKERLGIGKYAN